MLLELFTTLLEDIQTAVPEFKRVDRYKFEFEQGTDWDPEYPICFMRYDGIKPNPRTVIADGSYTKAYIYLTLFIGDEDINSPVVLDKVEKVQSLFVNSFITIPVESVDRKFNITLSENGTELHGYVKGVEVYRVGLKIEIPYKLIQLVAEPPEQVTLVSPANGATSIDINNADCEWNDAGAGVTGYDMVISPNSDFSVEVFRVSKYSYLKLTVPNGLLADETVYYWKVRAKGSGINGAWSETRSFTTGVTEEILPLTFLQAGLNDIYVRGDNLTLSGSKVSSWNDQSGNARHLTNSTDANRPITETLHGRTFVKFEGTYASNGIRNLSVVDSIHLFKMTGTQTRTFAWVLRTRTNSIVNAIMARSNNSVGDEYYFRIPSNFGTPPLFNYYGFPKSSSTTAGEAILPENIEVTRLVILEVAGTAGKLFIDGNLIWSGTLVFNADINLPANAATFFVLGGVRQPSHTQGTFAGAIGEFASGAKILTADEHAAILKQYQNYYNL